MTLAPPEISQLLHAWGDGDQTARDRLVPLATQAHHTQNETTPPSFAHKLRGGNQYGDLPHSCEFGDREP